MPAVDEAVIVQIILRQLGRRTLVVAIELGHPSHVKRAETSHNSLPVILVLPHLRVLLRQLTVADDGVLPVLSQYAICVTLLLLLLPQLRFFLLLPVQREIIFRA